MQNFPIVYGKLIPDKDFSYFKYLDYDKEYVGGEYNIQKYRVIRTFAKNYESRYVREVREKAQMQFKGCLNIETLRTENDIYNYLSNSDNILISILDNDVYYMYCLSRSMMSKRAMNNKNFRYTHEGRDYVKFLPKIWTSEEGFQALLHSDYSIYLFNSAVPFDSIIGNYDYDDETDEAFPYAQHENYGMFVKFDKAWDLLYFERILHGKN